VRGWAIRRALAAVPVVAGITVLTFALIHLAPGDPIVLLAGDGGSPSYYADMREKFGLDRPLAEQFLRYAGAALTGDFGYSFAYQAPVSHVLGSHAAASLLIGASALMIATGAGFGLALLSTIRESRRLDAIIGVCTSVMYAAPVFWTGQVLIIVVAVKLGLLPVGGMTAARETARGLAFTLDVARHLVLPAVTLSLPFLAVVTSVCRAGLRDAMREPFVQAALARGLPRPRVVMRHVAPHATVALATLVGQHAPQIVAGAALTEWLFGWPGLGTVVLEASLHRDYPLVTSSFLVIASTVVCVNAATDALCAWLDPRIRLT
jgi:peptide/nickel transport system permease protein